MSNILVVFSNNSFVIPIGKSREFFGLIWKPKICCLSSDLASNNLRLTTLFSPFDIALGDPTTWLIGCSDDCRLLMLDAVVGGAWLSKGLGIKFFSGGDCRNSGGDIRGFNDEVRRTSNTSYCLKIINGIIKWLWPLVRSRWNDIKYLYLKMLTYLAPSLHWNSVWVYSNSLLRGRQI